MKSLYTKILSVVMAQKMVAGGVAVVALIIGGILWSSNGGTYQTLTVSRSEFVQTVSVSGKVVAENQVDLGFSQSGRIARVYVKEGETVYAGNLIAEIENGDLYANLLQKQAALDRAEAQLDALKRGTRLEEIAVYESAEASARATLAATNQGLVDAVLSGFSTSDSAIHSTVDQFFSNPNSTSPQLAVLVSSSALESLVESGRFTTGKMLDEWQGKSATAAEAQHYLMKISIFLADVSGALASAIPSSAVTQTAIDSYKTSVSTARTSINTAISTLTTAVKTQTAAQTALVTSERDLALKRAGTTAEDLRAQEASVQVAEADVLYASAQLQKTQIRAPFKGTVTKIGAKVGESVAPSEAQVSVIGSGVFQIETFVPEINVALVKRGDSARVTFDSYGSDAVFPAEVLTVDLGETIKDGVSTYRTVLVFKETDPRIRSGMTANVLITTRTMSDVISIPQKLVVLKNGVPTVRVMENDLPVDRTVSVGAVSSSGSIEVLSGLLVGDLVLKE